MKQVALIILLSLSGCNVYKIYNKQIRLVVYDIHRFSETMCDYYMITIKHNEDMTVVVRGLCGLHNDGDTVYIHNSP